MEKNSPSQSLILRTLLAADFAVQWRNRRASILSMLAPVVILVSWKSIINAFGAPFALASCITIGLIAVGLMGYANTVARDRERGVFQRLRVTPAGTTAIMTSRIIVQLVQMMVMTIVVFIVGYFVDAIVLTPFAYVLATIVSVVCGAVFLGLAQAIVGLISRAETVNSVTRFIYIALIVLGILGEFGTLGNAFKQAVLWSPYGTVKVVLQAAMMPSNWGSTAWIALVVTFLYAIVFSIIGIKWFDWNSKN